MLLNKENRRLILMIGLPGSGKSTYVREILVPQGVQVVCPDAIRAAYGHRFHGPLEPSVHADAMLQARQHMLQGFDVVIDESTTRSRHLRRWKTLAEHMGYTVSVIHVDTDKDICLQRRSEDGTGFPLEVIERKDEELSYDWPHIAALFPNMITINGTNEETQEDNE